MGKTNRGGDFNGGRKTGKGKAKKRIVESVSLLQKGGGASREGVSLSTNRAPGG